MEVSKFLSAMENIGDSLTAIIDVLIFIAKFLFLTPWGWIIILIAFASMVIVRIKNRKDEITFYSFIGGISESLLWLYSNVTTILIGVFIVLILSFIASGYSDLKDAMKIYSEVKTLEAALKNLESERKVLEIQATPLQINGTNRINVTATYFAHSSVSEDNLEVAQRVYSIAGNRLYVDFGVINFEYSLIENGNEINLAIPHMIYSDTIAFEEGVDIFATEEDMPLTFKLDENEIFLMDQDEYEETMMMIIGYATNEAKARELGLRTSYGQSVSLAPHEGTTYTIYSTGTGGIVVE